MIPSTLAGLAITLAFLAPGLLYEQGIERSLGYWRTSLADRVLRFFIESVLLQALVSPISFLVWDRYLRSGLDAPHEVNFVLYAALIGYLALPFLLGLGVGAGARSNPAAWWVVPAVGRDPAPRAWDYLFSSRPTGYVRARMKKDGRWVAGVYALDERTGRIGYASSVSGADDLYIPVELTCDPVTAELALDAEGRPRRLDWGLLLRRDDIDLIEFQEWSATMGSAAEEES